MQSEAIQSETIKYQEAWTPQIIPDPDSPGKFRINDVPIFEVHDNRGFDYDADWMAQCIQHQQKDKRERNFLPRLIKGHTPEDRDARTEQPAAGFLDNYKFDARSGWLRADFVGMSQATADEIKDNHWPGRSVEVIPDQYSIPVVAMLGESPPFFKLPDVRFQDHSKAIRYSVEINAMKTDDKKKTDAKPAVADDKPEKYKGKKKHEDDISEDERDMFRKFMAFMADEECKKNMSNDDPDKNMDDKNMDKHQETVSREKYDNLLARTVKLEDDNERAQWRQKFSLAQIPEGRIDVGENIDLIMSIPKDQREKYFENITKAVARPSRDKVMEDAKAPVQAGTQRELGSFRKYCEDNRERYNLADPTQYAAAMKDWRAENAA